MGVYGSMKMRGYTYYHNWVFRENRVLLQEYLDDAWERIEHESIMEEFDDDPRLGYQVLTDYHDNKYDPDKNWKRILNYIRQPGHDIILVSGSKRSGKTFDAWRLLDALRDEFAPFWVGEPSVLPEWCDIAVDLYSTPPNSLSIVDEAVLKMNARRSLSKASVDASEIIPIIAHSGRKAIYITQNTSRSDVNLVSWADMHIQKNYTGIYSRATERKEILNKVDDFFLPLLRNIEWSYAISNEFRCMYKGPPLPWYNDTISKSFSHFNNDKEALTYATRMAISDYEAKNLEQIMRLRGFRRPMDYWESFIQQSKTNPAQAIERTMKNNDYQKQLA